MSQHSIVDPISALLVLGTKVSLQANNVQNTVHDPPPSFFQLPNKLSELCSVLRQLENTLRDTRHSIPPFPPGLSNDLSFVLDNCMTDLARLQTDLQRLSDSEHGDFFVKMQGKSWRYMFADKDFAQARNCLEAQKHALNVALTLAQKYMSPSLHVPFHDC